MHKKQLMIHDWHFVRDIEQIKFRYKKTKEILHTLKQVRRWYRGTDHVLVHSVVIKKWE